MAAGAVQIRRVGDALGAEVVGIDWSEDVDADAIAQVRRAWLEHHVLIFKGQRLSPDRLIEFGRALGDLEVVKTFGGLDGYPEILPLVKEPSDQLNVGEGWHIDSTYRAAPPAGAVLYSIEVPPQGGDTLFANMYAAYDSLSAGMRRLLEGLRVVHANGYLGDAAAVNERQAQQSMKVQMAPKVEMAEHPLVRTHPETGRKCLYVNKLLADGGMTSHFVDMTSAETQSLIGYLCDHAAREEFTYRVSWEPDMLVLYDNRCLQHNAPNDYQGFRREMWRLSLAGDVPA